MLKTCIIASAGGRYTSYAWLFKFCCQRAYPEYEVFVERTEPTRMAISTPFFAACERFLIPYPQYDYVYITDIDMMICPETPSLLDFHLAEMKATGLPYSNVPRWREPMGSNRLTGLHFVSKDWWPITKAAREKEQSDLYAGKIGSGKCDDEQMLMRIARNSGLAIPENSELLCRHHGIHLGTIRDYRPKSLQSMKMAVSKRVTKEKAVYWQGLIQEPEYKALRETARRSDNQTFWELTQLERWTAQLCK